MADSISHSDFIVVAQRGISAMRILISVQNIQARTAKIFV
jgi:hypothetical protein